MRRHIQAVAAVLAGGCTALAASPAAAPDAIPMREDSGVYMVPVTLDGIATVDCIVDSGASDVNIPKDVFRKLVRAGAIKDSDFVGTREYVLADGSSVKGQVFRIRMLKVGSVVVKDVLASVGADNGGGLLGQSFLARFKSWSVDNTRHALLLTGAPSAPPATDRPVVARGGPSGATAGGGQADPGGKTVAQVSGHGGAEPPAGRTQSQGRDDDGGPLAAQTGR